MIIERIRNMTFLAVISIVVLWLPDTVLAQCDETMVAESKQYFKRLRTEFVRDSVSVDEWDLRVAAQDYIQSAERCYQAKYGASSADQKIDTGGMLMGSSGAYAASQNPTQNLTQKGGTPPPKLEHVLFGTKWGSGSPFTAGTNVAGPQSAGGEVTYSYMNNGVDLSAEGGSPGLNVAVTSMNNFDQCFLQDIEEAFGAWSAVANITFKHVADGGLPFNTGAVANIRIGAHTFDGAGGTLAHSFFPPPNGVTAAGDVHFDKDEAWFCYPWWGAEVDFGIVALHEIGHAIGLGHEVSDLAIMNGAYNRTLNFGPLADDIIGVAEIYGAGNAAGKTFFGRVGIGTDTPTSTLHVLGSNGSAKILVEETTAAVAPRTLFQLKNKGNTKFAVFNTDANVEWAFANPGTGFRLSRQGSGVVEMEILNNGNVTIAGTLTQNSDVNEKTAITEIHADEILNLVNRLPVSRWEYKDALGESHIGPMAQDFYAAFGLGATDTGISSIDTAGVALVAIKALSQKNVSLQQRVQELEQQNQRIEELVLRLVTHQAEQVAVN